MIDMIAVSEAPTRIQAPQISDLHYSGNALSDAQIALGIHGEMHERGHTLKLSDEFINWATNGGSIGLNGKCVCNGDIMFHTGKGAMGIRIDNSLCFSFFFVFVIRFFFFSCA